MANSKDLTAFNHQLGATALCDALAQHRNDLEAPIALQPVIADVLAALRAAPGCTLARMSQGCPGKVQA